MLGASVLPWFVEELLRSLHLAAQQQPHALVGQLQPPEILRVHTLPRGRRRDGRTRCHRSFTVCRSLTSGCSQVVDSPPISTCPFSEIGRSRIDDLSAPPTSVGYAHARHDCTWYSPSAAASRSEYIHSSTHDGYRVRPAAESQKQGKIVTDPSLKNWRETVSRVAVEDGAGFYGAEVLLVWDFSSPPGTKLAGVVTVVSVYTKRWPDLVFVLQVKKSSNKWLCKVCNEKQSVQKVRGHFLFMASITVHTETLLVLPCKPSFRSLSQIGLKRPFHA